MSFITNRSFLILLLLICCLPGPLLQAQSLTSPAEYEAKWKKVDSLSGAAGLTGSALAAVNRIYTLAKTEKNDVQVIKALIYRRDLRSFNTQDAIDSTIAELQKEVAGARQPIRSVLQNILAYEYWSYWQSNRYKLYGRTNTAGIVKTDIGVWTADDLRGKIEELYLASLKEEKLLADIRVETFEPILIKGNSRRLRPTLFDVLAHEALEYFRNSEASVMQAASVFQIEDPAAYADAGIFSRHEFRTEDSLSVHFQAVRLFQRLIRLHLSDPAPDALIDVDLERIDFVHTYAIMDKSDELYRQALVRLTDRYGTLPAGAEAWYRLALQYRTKSLVKPRPGVRDGGNAASDEDTAARVGNLWALAICDKVLAEKDSSEGKTNCGNLRNQILAPLLQLQTEAVNLPNQPFRSLVTWSNIDRLYLRIIRIDSVEKHIPLIRTWEDAYWNKLLSLPVYRSSVQSLPPTSDHRSHSTEIATASLPAGSYVLLASTLPGWNLSEGVMTVQYLSVSSIAFINNGRNYFVLDRGSGQPLAGATAQVWQSKYNNLNNTLDWVRKESYQTDKQGHFLVRESKNSDYNGRALDIRLGDDHLFLPNTQIPYFAPATTTDTSQEKEEFEMEWAHTFFFLDRSIYRPGQTVYFKGIVITEDMDTRKPKVFPNLPRTVYLYNVNDVEVDSMELTTNAFGSYNGTFHLPANTQNGKFHIGEKTTNETIYFSVEEYKRPKFFVEYERQKGSYRVGDSVLVTGNVKAYAGNAIDGAKVSYRVVRNARFPYYWLFWRGGHPSSVSQEIAQGEVRTGTDGKFRLRFVARPDKGVDPSSYPEFDYAVTADVTDINGETRSGSSHILAGYTAMKLSVSLAQGNSLPADSLKAVAVSATNLSGEPVGASVHIAIYPLKSPQRLIRQRYWEAPDLYALSEKDFLDSFPHDEYRQETNHESWAREARVWDTTVLLSGDRAERSIPVSGPLKSGWYLIEASAKDASGREVTDIVYAALYDPATGRPPAPQYNWATSTGGVQAEPGEKVKVSVGSSARNVFVIRTVDRPEGGIFRKAVYFKSRSEQAGAGNFMYLTIDQDKTTVDWNITEADHGGFGINDVFVKDNRVYTHLFTVVVPWTNKELKIGYATYRDKTEPGSEEKWKVTISGARKEPVAAELLTAMYDASLDQFTPQAWSVPYIYPVYYQQNYWESIGNFQPIGSQERSYGGNPNLGYDKRYDRLLSSTFAIHYKLSKDAVQYRLNGAVAGITRQQMAVGPKGYFSNATEGIMERNLLEDKVVIGYGTARRPSPAPGSGLSAEPPAPVQIRKNFNETAFFFPDLQTDSAGNVSFSFTIPEALTTWKWMTLAHTRDAAFGYSEKNVITQKKLMVQPNVPRFLREGDRMELSVKVSNLTDSEMTGQMALQLTDPTTGETADGMFLNRQPNQYFTIGAGQSGEVSFPLDIPLNYSRPLRYRVVAQSGNYSDGEEATLPVVTNRMLVTESLPLNMPGDGTRHFTFDKLLKSGASETLNNRSLTVEFTANPAWYAVQALPYLMEYPYECAEQTFNRFYANALASKIVSSSPRLQAVFARWNTRDTAALLSNLQKNAELKSVLLEETPWVLQGKTEEQQKRNIALLFDMSRMSKELMSALDKLKDKQTGGGAFVWFKGGPDDRYITQYILTGIGHLQHLGAVPPAMESEIKKIVTAGLAYLDEEIRKDYERSLKEEARTGGGKTAAGAGGGAKATSSPIGELEAQYLYMRSLFGDYGIPGNTFPAINYYRKRAQQSWLQSSRYMQGMIALALFRTGDVQTAKNIIESLRQNAIRDEEKGMYWLGMEGGYYWYQAPIEMQSLLIEAFHEISGDAAIDRQLKTWLLKQKQTHSWPTTKATADACYALLLGGTDWLTAERDIEIKLGDKTVLWGAGGDGAAGDAGAAATGSGEAGTGYNKKIFDGAFVNPSMGNIDVTMRTRSDGGSAVAGAAADGGAKAAANGGSPAWGAVYWQYFDNLDQITPTGGNKTALRLSKRLFIERNTDKGPVLEPLAENGTLRVGDKVTVRVELKVDRDLEYVHMKDMRAACMEPLDVISGYKWQGGLGYYQSTRDASTDFFFSQLPRGTYVFEYSLSAGQAGNFSNGVTSIECMYAPEFSYHSEGIRVNVEAAP